MYDGQALVEVVNLEKKERCVLCSDVTKHNLIYNFRVAKSLEPSSEQNFQSLQTFLKML